MTTTAEPAKAELAVVGKPVPRVEGRKKVSGHALYAADVRLPGMLHAKLLHAPFAHAVIKRIDTAKARRLDGVELVLTAKDLPQFEARRKSNRAYVLLADDEVVFSGQPVAAVAASSPSIAEEALDLIDVEYEPLPVVLDPVAALDPASPLARQPVQGIDRSEAQGHVSLDVSGQEGAGKPTNIASQIRFTRGDVEQGFAEADVVLERTYRSAFMHQGYIEPHVTVADYDPASEELTLYTGTQGQFFVRDQISNMLRIPQTKLRVVGMELGGGFGGKIFLTQALAAVMAFAARRPVKLVYSRSEDLTAATPSGGCVVELKTGMKRDGRLTALKARLVYDSGAFPGAPAVVGAILLGGSYRIPHLDIESFEVLTNKVSVGAIRAPGAHNAAFAIESQIDEMCRTLGLDPLRARLENAVTEGDEMPSQQKYPRIGLRETLDAVARHPVWLERAAFTAAAPPGRKRGVGLAVGGWLGGLQPASAIVELNADGTVNVVVGANDVTGTNTAFAQIAAEELAVDVSQVSVTTGDTRTAPFAGMSAGSKTLFTVGRAVKAAAEDARRQLLAVAAERLGVTAEDELELSGGEVRVKGQPDKALTFRRIGGITTGFGAQHAPIIGRASITARRQAPGFTAQVAAIEVDEATGEVTVLRWVSAQDAGFAVNPLNVEGQIQGGTTQGIGIALWEELIFDGQGKLRNPSLLDYRMPTAADVPPIETVIVEVPSEDGPYGARGVGEPSIVPGAAAVANAIRDALGVRVTEAPITPERILRALGRC